MKTFTLECGTCEVTGETGLFLADLPRMPDAMADTGMGSLIAHDVLEHVNGPSAIGTIDDELEAMGAAWYVRGQHAMITRGPAYHAPHVNIAADVARMAVEFLQGHYVTVDAIPRTRECDADADFDDVLERAERDTRAERAHDDPEDDDSDRLELYMRAARARLRIGYRKAARKYRDVNASRLFWTVADAVRDCIRTGELIEGARYTLRINARECVATCSIVSEWE